VADLSALRSAVLSVGARSPAPEATRPQVEITKPNPIGAEERTALLAVAELAATRARQRELPAPHADLGAASAAMDHLWHLQVPELVALRDRWPGRSDAMLSDAQRAIRDGQLLGASQVIQRVLHTVDLPVIGEKEAARMVVAAAVTCGSAEEAGTNQALQQLLAAWKIRAFSPRVSDEFDPAKHRNIRSVKGTQFDHRQIAKVERPGYQSLNGEIIEPAWVLVGG
jgi:hypothetical protein